MWLPYACELPSFFQVVPTALKYSHFRLENSLLLTYSVPLDAISSQVNLSALAFTATHVRQVSLSLACCLNFLTSVSSQDILVTWRRLLALLSRQYILVFWQYLLRRLSGADIQPTRLWPTREDRDKLTHLVWLFMASRASIRISSMCVYVGCTEGHYSTLENHNCSPCPANTYSRIQAANAVHSLHLR